MYLLSVFDRRFFDFCFSVSFVDILESEPIANLKLQISEANSNAGFTEAQRPQRKSTEPFSVFEFYLDRKHRFQ